MRWKMGNGDETRDEGLGGNERGLVYSKSEPKAHACALGSVSILRYETELLDPKTREKGKESSARDCKIDKGTPLHFATKKVGKTWRRRRNNLLTSKHDSICDGDEQRIRGNGGIHLSVLKNADADMQVCVRCCSPPDQWIFRNFY